MRLIDQWIIDYHLSVKWESDVLFKLDGKDYLYLNHKEGKIFDQDFNLILSAEEKLEILVDYYCFEFGGKIYRTSVKEEKVKLEVLKHIGKADGETGFDYLGVHGGYELCGGSRTYEDWCKKAKFFDVKVLGICEKHTLAGVLKFQMACDKAGIKSIIGETITVKGKESEYKVKLYVKDEVGW